MNRLESKESLKLKFIKLALQRGMRVSWGSGDGSHGHVTQAVNGLYIVAHCQSQGSISMPLLWSDGKTFTRPIDEIQIETTDNMIWYYEDVFKPCDFKSMPLKRIKMKKSLP